MADTDHIKDARYAGAEWHAIVVMGRLGVRFGPFSSERAEQIMDLCAAEGIDVHFTAVCGPEFDIEVARAVQAVTNEDREITKRRAREGYDLLLTTARTVRDLLREPHGAEEEQTALDALEEVLRPFETVPVVAADAK